MLRGKNIIIAICGGIAAYKIPVLVRLLKKNGANVKVVLTASASRFVSELTLATVSQEQVYCSLFPPAESGNVDYTRHISLGEWADIFVVAPATANTIAKLAAGLCDDMLSACFLTLRPNKPVLLFPAMDGQMFNSSSVQRNLALLLAEGSRIINPESGELASGQCGLGRMPEPEAIAALIEEELQKSCRHSSLQGKSVVITAGPTREKIDGVRFISNYSSGKMGFALARAAAERGAKVTLLAGPVSLVTPPLVERVDVESAKEMYDAACTHFETCDVFISAAAIADYRPEAPFQGKLKKTGEELTLTLKKNPDILAEFGKQKSPGQIAVGFALECEDGLKNAIKKRIEKNLDLIALNFYDGKSSGFEVETNMLTLIGRDNEATLLPLLSKPDAANRLLEAVEKLIQPGC
ncbi:MAG: bifunctional phosphopantothenoylcysteine decarboxylase/phosphopantothenate--cysteine ligase CoaBC [Chlorobiaceae bacterium]|jgi:phosphopantothenoylcysteine decarboxylase / phosphopantothenate---cysteine ligase|nr:bifunctional phosphopantothenoylcysteine decarboxylase/phosphopantothenate--cysteine ligase CoaBC [Chlorobiaceae bacterium]NTW63158.1 bifunctional phosphopantothenoylcysteine decarboxylase/phosphopantothenate--cysteine ligase CoaBC [Chlorobiaceae bacterium]